MTPRIMTLAMAVLFTAPWTQADCDKCKCPSQAAMKELPRLEYQVGSATVTCSKSAAELSKQEGVPVCFVIGDKTYSEEATAMLALAEKTEAALTYIVTPIECDVRGTTAVGGRKMECSKETAATAKLIQNAIDAVSVSYKVGEVECNCPHESKRLAAATKADVMLCVAGKETTCPVLHRINIARARYRAAVEALAVSDADPAR